MPPRTHAMPRMVRGGPPTSWGFDGTGVPSLLALVLLAGCLGGFPSTALADRVRLEWAPVAPLVDLTARPEVAFYALERRTASGWERVAEVQHSASDHHYRYDRGTFLVDVPEGIYRLVSVDPVGNQSAPVEFAASAESCEWPVGGGSVQVACGVQCSCGDLVQVLDSARGELVRHGLVDPPRFDAAVLGLHAIAVVAPEVLVVDGRRVKGLFGEDRTGRRLLYLTPDLGAALHELFHAYERAEGRPWTSAEDHPRWERDPRLSELDLRFQEAQRRRVR